METNGKFKEEVTNENVVRLLEELLVEVKKLNKETIVYVSPEVYDMYKQEKNGKF